MNPTPGVLTSTFELFDNLRLAIKTFSNDFKTTKQLSPFI